MFRLEIRQPRRKTYFARKRFQKTVRIRRGEADEGGPTRQVQTLKQSSPAPRLAMVAGVDPRRGRGIGGYLRVHGVLPRRWVVDLAVGEHHVDGGLNSGGRWFGRG